MSDGQTRHGVQCPVCGQTLATCPALRRCPRCGARTLWRNAEMGPPLPLVLFTARLCGVIAGIQVSLLLLLSGGYHLPLPLAVVGAAALLPLVGYALAGLGALHIAPEWRRGYLTLVLALDCGLLGALIIAQCGLAEPVSLLVATVLGTAAAWSPLSRKLTTWSELNT